MVGFNKIGRDQTWLTPHILRGRTFRHPSVGFAYIVVTPANYSPRSAAERGAGVQAKSTEPRFPLSFPGTALARTLAPARPRSGSARGHQGKCTLPQARAGMAEAQARHLNQIWSHPKENAEPLDEARRGP